MRTFIAGLILGLVLSILVILYAKWRDANNYKELKHED